MTRTCFLSAFYDSSKVCSLEWGHDGDKHLMGGVLLLAHKAEEHARRQKQRAAGHVPTTESLMMLLRDLTGWGDSLRVSMAYSPPGRTRDEDRNPVGPVLPGYFYVATTMCGSKDLQVKGRGVCVEDALEDLALSIPKSVEMTRRWYDDNIKNAEKRLVEAGFELRRY